MWNFFGRGDTNDDKKHKSNTNRRLLLNSFLSRKEQKAFERVSSPEKISKTDPIWKGIIFNLQHTLLELSTEELYQFKTSYFDTFARNNERSGNFAILVEHLIEILPFCCRMMSMCPVGEVEDVSEDDELSSVNVAFTSKEVQNVCNGLFLARNVFLCLMEDKIEVDYSFNNVNNQESMGSFVTEEKSKHEDSTTEPSLALQFLQVLLTIIIDFEPTNDTYDFHMEVINTTIILLCNPIFYSPEDMKLSKFSIMELLMKTTLLENKHWAESIVKNILEDYMNPILAPASSRKSASSIATQNYLESTQVARFAETQPDNTYNFFKGMFGYAFSEEKSVHPLADRGLLLLLLLVNDCRSQSLRNPYREVFSSLVDEKACSAPEKVPYIKDQSRFAVIVSFEKLINAVSKKMRCEADVLLLYTLIHSNDMFLQTLLSSSDIESLFLPLLEILYNAQYLRSWQIYILTITLLIFSQDVSFVRNAHRNMVVECVPWYKERTLESISLGSLIMVVLLRLIQRNITQFQDSYLHTNSFATLSNLAPHLENIHSYAAQRLVDLIDILSRKEALLTRRLSQDKAIHNSLIRKKRSEESKDDKNSVKDTVDYINFAYYIIFLMITQRAQRKEAYTEFIRLLLEVLSACLSKQQLPRNPRLIYTVLYQKSVIETLSVHPQLQECVKSSNILEVVSHFRSLIFKNGDDVGEDVSFESVLVQIQEGCLQIAISNGLSFEENDVANFQYEEGNEPEIFFVPYVWSLIYESTTDFCWENSSINLFPLPETLQLDCSYVENSSK